MYMDICRGSLSCLPHHTSLTYVRFIRYLWVMGTSSKLKCHKTKRKPAMGIRWPWFYKHGEAARRWSRIASFSYEDSWIRDDENSSRSSWTELENQATFLVIYFVPSWRVRSLTFKVPPNPESLWSSCLVRWLPREGALLEDVEIKVIMLDSTNSAFSEELLLSCI